MQYLKNFQVFCGSVLVILMALALFRLLVLIIMPILAVFHSFVLRGEVTLESISGFHTASYCTWQ